jgi:hypothetical protein
VVATDERGQPDGATEAIFSFEEKQNRSAIGLKRDG